MNEPRDPADVPPDGAERDPDGESERALLIEYALHQARRALRLASASLPHLAGLARLVRVRATSRVDVAAIGSSGLLVVRPELFAGLPLGDAAFIMAHELMHLALDTSGRIGEANRLVGNFAHDYIINDMLAVELERDPPLGGLYHEGAREKSFEQWIVDLSRGGDPNARMRVWWPFGGRIPRGGSRQAPSSMSRALADAGLIDAEPPEAPPESCPQGDLLDPDEEAEFEPELSPDMRDALRQQVKRAAAKAASLGELAKKLQDGQGTATVNDPQRHEEMMAALRAAYHTPWQLALQHWMDAVAPGERTYARPSRRGVVSADVVLPGRRREGWTLHIILDTSGSMSALLPTALGALGHFCDAAGVLDVHVVQCDTEVTRDEWIDAASLANYKISGFGYSDMSPAMARLADDPEVAAVLMLTDGDIGILEREPPYRMLWVILGEGGQSFRPAYGDVVRLAT
jgi:predicted metal-dependent peptidase